MLNLTKCLLTVPMLILMSSACSKSDTITREIQGRRFDIPRKNVVESTIFFLPASQNDAVRFVINPTAPLPEQHVVSFHRNATCPPSDGSTPSDAKCQVRPTSLRQLEGAKLTRTGDDIYWQYRLADTGGLVAYCYALVQGDGLCTHHSLYKGAPYNIGFKDSQMPNLVALRRTTEGLLSRWEQST